MTAKGHMILSLPVATGLNLLLEKTFFVMPLDRIELMFFYLVVLVGSLFPDIDEPGSYIGRKLPVFSHILSAFIEHRGITHFLILPAAMIVGNLYVQDFYTKLALYSFAIGVLCHDVGDLLTKGGIRGFFFPFFSSSTFGLLPRPLRFYTDSIVEYVVIFLLLGLNVFLAMKLNFLGI